MNDYLNASCLTLHYASTGTASDVNTKNVNRIKKASDEPVICNTV